MICPVCKRETPEEYVEKHHLIPKQKGGRHKETLEMCCDCADMLHQLFTNKELAKQYNTLEKILANEKIIKWVDWVSRKTDSFGICMKRKKRR